MGWRQDCTRCVSRGVEMVEQPGVQEGSDCTSVYAVVPDNTVQFVWDGSVYKD